MNREITTTITQVTVYPDRAQIIRQGQSEVTTAIKELVIDQLPLTLDVASVRVHGEGTAKVRILSVDVQRHHYRETPAEQIRELEQKFLEVEALISADDDQLAVIAGQLTHLEGVRQQTEQFARGIALGRISAEQQLAWLQSTRQSESQLYEQRRTLQQTKREHERTRDLLRQQLQANQSSRPKERFRARIAVEVLADGTFAPSLSYVVHSAGWTPQYDLRLLGNNTVELTQLAQVTQRTGEDWQAMPLILSTSRPSLTQSFPKLETWYLDVARPLPPPQPIVRAARPMAKMTMASGAVDDGVMMASAEPAVQSAEIATATIETQGTAVRFVIGGNSDIPSDGTPHNVTIGAHFLTPKLDYVAIPRLTQVVYRRAKLTNTTPAPFLAGQANLFVQDEFIGRNQIHFTPQGDEIEFVLGVEDRLTVERKLLHRQVDKQFMRERRTISYSWAIEMSNLQSSPATISLEDHIPVSRHEEIKVNFDGARPQLQEKSDLNLLRWSLTLPAHSKQIVQYDYSVNYPRTLEVAGLTE